MATTGGIARASGGQPRAARPAARRQVAALTGLAIVAIAAAEGPPAASAGTRRPAAVRATQELVVLQKAHRVVSLKSQKVASELQAGASRVPRVQAWRPITGQQTVLPVIGRATTTDKAHWLRVMLPGRPNGTKGWITQRKTIVTKTRWHIVVRTATRRVLVYRSGRLLRSLSAIVGKPSTPTPHGKFFVEESVRMAPRSAGAPFALALSARSNVLQEFAGGPGQIALHGMTGLNGTLGTAISHGCVRLSNRNITWLATRITPGVPITITR